ncbi:hypothetical protein D3C72_1838510 [compost metagenome]
MPADQGYLASLELRRQLPQRLHAETAQHHAVRRLLQCLLGDTPPFAGIAMPIQCLHLPTDQPGRPLDAAIHRDHPAVAKVGGEEHHPLARHCHRPLLGPCPVGMAGDNQQAEQAGDQ